MQCLVTMSLILAIECSLVFREQKQPDFLLSSKSDLLSLLRRYSPQGGLAVKPLRESWPGVTQAIEELELEGRVLVTRTDGVRGENGNQTKGQMKCVFLDDVGKDKEPLDQEFKDLWHSLKTPMGDDLVEELQSGKPKLTRFLLSLLSFSGRNATLNSSPTCTVFNSRFDFEFITTPEPSEQEKVEREERVGKFKQEVQDYKHSLEGGRPLEGFRSSSEMRHEFGTLRPVKSSWSVFRASFSKMQVCFAKLVLLLSPLLVPHLASTLCTSIPSSLAGLLPSRVYPHSSSLPSCI